MEHVGNPAGAAASIRQPSPLEQEYTQVNENIRWLADIRFKLLAFVPALGGVAVYVLATAGLSAESGTRQPTNDDLWLIALISAIGLVVTLGIVFYDQRNSALYNALIHRAKFIETELKLPRSPNMPKKGQSGGQFNERPGRDRRLFGLKLFEVKHDTALALIYGPVLGAWFFPLLLSVLNLAGDSSLIAFLLAATIAVFAGGAFTWELVRQDRADSKRWNMAGLVDSLTSDLRQDLLRNPPTNETELNEGVETSLEHQKDKLKREYPKIKLELVRSVPNQLPEDKDLLIQSKYIHESESVRMAAEDTRMAIKNKEFPKRYYEFRPHFLLFFASDPAQAVVDAEEYETGIDLEDHCTVRIVSPRPQKVDPRAGDSNDVQAGEQR